MSRWRERFNEERDRRYTEVRIEQEKALVIKEKADDKALVLASEIQKYKDEKANELRAQIEGERHLYVTRADLQNLSDKTEAALKPVSEFVASQLATQSSQRAGALDARSLVFGVLFLVVAIIALIAPHIH